MITYSCISTFKSFFFQTLSDLDIASDSDVECAPKIIKKLPKLVSVKDGDVTK